MRFVPGACAVFQLSFITVISNHKANLLEDDNAHKS